MSESTDLNGMEQVTDAIRWSIHQAHRHLDSEYSAPSADPIMDTLWDSSTLVFTPPCTVRDGTSIHLPLITDRDEIRAFYESVYKLIGAVEGHDLLVQVGGPWYTFLEAAARVPGMPTDGPTRAMLLLFPTGSGPGVGGEIMFPCSPSYPGMAPPAESSITRRQVTRLHSDLGSLLAGSYEGDADALLDEHVQMVLPVPAGEGYQKVDGRSSAVQLLETKSAHGVVDQPEVVQLVVGAWYFFSELRWPFGDPGQPRRYFSTAQFGVVGQECRLMALCALRGPVTA